MNGDATCAAVRRPLAGRRIVVTRAQDMAGSLTGRLAALGAMVEEAALLRFDPPASYVPLDDALANLSRYDVLLVTSANTARVLAERRPAPWPDQPWTAAIGPATADAVRAAGLRVDMVPAEAVGDALLAGLRGTAGGKRILLPRATVAQETLPDGLRAAGAQVEVIPAYQTRPAWETQPRLIGLFAPDAPKVDCVTFTSGSTVEHFFLLLGQQQAKAALVSALACAIGPVTAAALKHHGVERVAVAKTHTLSSLVELLVSTIAGDTVEQRHGNATETV